MVRFLGARYGYQKMVSIISFSTKLSIRDLSLFSSRITYFFGWKWRRAQGTIEEEHIHFRLKSDFIPISDCSYLTDWNRLIHTEWL